MTRLAFAAMIVAALTLAACRGQAPPPAASNPAAAPAADAAAAAAPATIAETAKPGAELSVVAVATGTEVGDDQRVITALDTFAPRDTVIVAITVVNASAAPVSGTVTARWIGPEGEIFNEESREQAFSGQQTVDFRVADPEGFKPGNYKLEIALNGSVVQTHDFSIH